MKLRAKVIINAPAREVFRVITDAALYPQFDQKCIKIYGDIEEGSEIKIYYNAEPQTYFANVITVRKEQEIIFSSATPFGFFVNMRTFRVIPKDDFTTEFHRQDEGQGPFLWLFKKRLENQTDIDEFCVGLKRFIESRP